jgi:hypothetical protein
VLPLKAILFRRHIDDNGLCPVCNIADEDVLHMIFKCSEVENIWKGLSLFDMVQRAIVHGRSGSEMLGSLLSSNQGEVEGFESINHRELVAVAAWYIWWLRRRRSHGEQIPPVLNCITSIRAITANAARAKRNQNMNEERKWVRPRSDYVKINVDAGFFPDAQAEATGVVIRNAQGFFIAAEGALLSHVPSAAMAEALAMLNGLKLAKKNWVSRWLKQRSFNIARGRKKFGTKKQLFTQILC